jgi:hypothetical protein
LKLLSKGNIYTYSGKRTVEDILEFARGGFEMHEPEKVPPELGYFGEIVKVYKHAYKTASKDLLSGNYFTIDVFLVFMPFIFGVTLLALFCIPGAKPPREARERRRVAQSADSGVETSADSSVPVSVRARPATSSTDGAANKED